MPTDGEGNRQDRPNASPDDRNSQELPASQVSSTRDSGSSASSSASIEDKDAIIESLRKEAAQRRVDAKRLADLEARYKADEDAKLSEREKLQQQELLIQELKVKADVKLAAADLGISQKLARLILPLEAIEYDEQGDPTNVAALLKAAAEEHEILVPANAAKTPGASNGANGREQQHSSQPQQQQRVTSGGAVNPGRSATNGSNSGLFDGDPQTVMARISHLSPSEYASRRAEITAFIAGNWNKLSGR